MYIKNPFVFSERASKIIASTPGERVKSFIQRLPAVCSRYALCISGPQGRSFCRAGVGVATGDHAQQQEE